MSDRTRTLAVVSGVLDFVSADAVLLMELGGAHVFFRDTVELVEQIPCLAVEIPDEGQDETFEDVLVRWHVWGHTSTQVLTIAARLRLILHGRQVTMGNATVIPTFVASSPAPGDKRVGAVRRVVDSRLEIVRQRATT